MCKGLFAGCVIPFPARCWLKNSTLSMAVTDHALNSQILPLQYVPCQGSMRASVGGHSQRQQQ